MENWIFFTGVPGSRWSGIAKRLCQHQTVNNTDCGNGRVYREMHFGNYFGPGMEHGHLFEKMDKLHPTILIDELESPYENKNHKQIRFLKSHTFAYHLDFIKSKFKKSKIMLVYRDSDISLNWWLEAGGFDIDYPKYDWYVDEKTMFEQIRIENQCILDFSKKVGVPLERFDSTWIKQNFGWDMTVGDYLSDVTVALI